MRGDGRLVAMPLSRPIIFAEENGDSCVNAAGLFLRRYCTEQGQWLWLLLKNRKRKDWGLPKGHQEPGETFCESAIRECAEETGIALLRIEDKPYELRYHIPSGKHKRVVYFPAVTQQHDVKLSKEHSSYAWCSFSQARKKLSGNSTGDLFSTHLQDLQVTHPET